MTKRPRTLTAAFVRTISQPGVYGDGRGGRGLSLRVHRTKTGRISRTWRQRLRIEGQLTSVGLGPYPEITLAEARRKALDNSRAVRHGGDPRGRGVPTFAEASKRTIELHRDGWKAGSPLPEQWESTFRLHAAPLLDKPVDRITSADVLGCLAPIWNSKPGAARKARHRISAVFRWCSGSPEGRIMAGNRLTTYRTARSALLAQRSCLTTAWLKSGYWCHEWRESTGAATHTPRPSQPGSVEGKVGRLERPNCRILDQPSARAARPFPWLSHEDRGVPSCERCRVRRPCHRDYATPSDRDSPSRSLLSARFSLARRLRGVSNGAPLRILPASR